MLIYNKRSGGKMSKKCALSLRQSETKQARASKNQSRSCPETTQGATSDVGLA